MRRKHPDFFSASERKAQTSAPAVSRRGDGPARRSSSQPTRTGSPDSGRPATGLGPGRRPTRSTEPRATTSPGARALVDWQEGWSQPGRAAPDRRCARSKAWSTKRASTSGTDMSATGRLRHSLPGRRTAARRPGSPPPPEGPPPPAARRPSDPPAYCVQARVAADCGRAIPLSVTSR
jgi:hypothetical protein